MLEKLRSQIISRISAKEAGGQTKTIKAKSSLKRQRIQDSIHDLIVFEEKNEVDQLAWKLINTQEFQRLRRIKQLGFSDLVFPGASHTRLAHSIGVFNNARRLLQIIERKIDKKFDPDKALTTAVAALLHDIGHGPFSHTFEGVQKSIGKKKKHEVWTSDIIVGDTEIHKVLDEFDTKLAEKVAGLLKQDNPKDIYDAVVSSQFDADRLDYLCRDRYMTGTHSGIFDLNWLLDCLEVGPIYIGSEAEGDFERIDGLYINRKGIQAAESYLLARYHLYSQVYLHKTTRAAEKMLAALLTRVVKCIEDERLAEVGLSANNPLVKFYSQEPSVASYLRLDDTVILSTVCELTEARDTVIRELANRILHRNLYKCFDVTPRADIARGNCREEFRAKMKEKLAQEIGIDVLIDSATLTAYGVHDYEERGALQKVLVGRPDGSGKTEDIGEHSPIIKSITDKMVLRIYASNPIHYEKVSAIWEEVK